MVGRLDEYSHYFFLCAVFSINIIVTLTTGVHRLSLSSTLKWNRVICGYTVYMFLWRCEWFSTNNYSLLLIEVGIFKFSRCDDTADGIAVFYFLGRLNYLYDYSSLKRNKLQLHDSYITMMEASKWIRDNYNPF